LLNDNYSGKIFEEKYSFDVIRAKEIDCTIDFEINRQNLINELNNRNYTYENIKDEFCKFLDLWSEKSDKEKLDEILTNAINTMQERYGHEPLVTQEMINYLSNKVAEDFVKYIYR